MLSDEAESLVQPAVIKETAQELAKLGKLESFKLESSATRGGMIARYYTASLTNKALSIVTRTWPNGLLEQYTLTAG